MVRLSCSSLGFTTHTFRNVPHSCFVCCTVLDSIVSENSVSLSFFPFCDKLVTLISQTQRTDDYPTLTMILFQACVMT